jgi:glyoxylase-like metal-dependent hydrolase (beta-lactamase superfamily II)
MNQIRIHVLHCGEVCVSPYLPFGGENCNLLKAAGLTTKREDRLWLPISAYLIEHPKGRILVDTGWHRAISPEGVFDKRAQIKHMSLALYIANQGKIEKGAAIDEQLAAMGIKPSGIDYLLLTHLDCDHVSGLKLVKDAKYILVAADEMRCAQKHKIRYTASMWNSVTLSKFDFSNTGIGPVGKSYDLFGDGSVQLVNIPGHSDGLFAVKVINNGKFVLLFSDGGYAQKSWEQMICPGISSNPDKQLKSLQWIRDESMLPNCLESLANHDPDIKPHIIII